MGAGDIIAKATIEGINGIMPNVIIPIIKEVIIPYIQTHYPTILTIFGINFITHALHNKWRNYKYK